MNNSGSIASRLTKGSAWAVLGKVSGAFFSLLLSAALARVLSPNDFGSYLLVFSIVNFFAMISQFGFKQSLVKFVAQSLAEKKPEKAKAYVKYALTVTGVLGICVAGIYYLFLADIYSEKIFNSPGIRVVAGASSVWIVLLTTQTVVTEAFRGLHDIRWASIFGGLVTSSIAVFILGVLWLQQESVLLANAILIIVVSSFISLSLALFLLSRHVVNFVGNYKLDLAEPLRASLPLFVSSITFFIISQGHLWVLGAYKPDADVAVFGADLKLVNMVVIPLLIMNNVIPPMISSYYTQNKFNTVEKILQTTATIAGLPSMIMLTVFLLLGEGILSIVYGSFYAKGYVALDIIIIGHLINIFTGSPGVLLIMANKQKILMYSSIVSSVIGIVLSLLLVVKYSYIGVSAGMCLGIVCHNIIMWYYCLSKLHISTHVSIASVANVYRKVRLKSANRMAQEWFWHISERLFRFIEDIIWSFKGYLVIECVGDSHVMIFNSLHKYYPDKLVRFRSISVKGATAYGLGNPSSATNAAAEFRYWLSKRKKASKVLFMLGEVDTGYVIWARSENNNKDPYVVMQDSLDNYQAFIKALNINSDDVLICSAPLPTICDDKNVGEVASLRSGIKASQKDRTKLTLDFNAHLKNFSVSNGYKYVDLDKESLDKETGLVHEYLLNKDVHDHHYEPKSFRSLLSHSINEAVIFSV